MASPSPTPPSLSPTPHPALLHQPPLPAVQNTTVSVSASTAAAAPPQTKRDKRRHALSEKLTTLTTSFHNPANPRARDTHYRAQLALLQADIHQVAKCDASGRDMRLLDDSSDTIHREVEDALSGMGLGDLVGRDRGNPKDDPSVMGGAGRWYGDFLERVNQGMEERDAQLTLLYNQYHHKSLSLAAHHTRSIVHAREEHKSLLSTIQQRLMARLKTQLKKLAAEKESSSSTTLSSLSSLSTSAYTDLTETNALLLHPSQFGIVPSMGSPTRRADDDPDKEPSRRKPRRRAGEVEELLSFGVGINFDPPSSNGKRKRNNRTTHPIIRDDVEDPTDTSPSGSVVNYDTPRGDPPTTESTRRRREELMKQVYAPIYSFDKLFTEKELQLAGNQASLATVRYFTERQHMHYGDDDSDADADTPLVDASDREDGNDTDQADAARVYSVNTRSNPPRPAGTREIESLVLGGVPGIGMTYVNKAGVAPPPPGLRSEDAESDLAAMRRGVERGYSGVPVGLGLAGVAGFAGLFSAVEMSRGESGRGDKRSAGVAGIGGGGDGKKVRRG